MLGVGVPPGIAFDILADGQGDNWGFVLAAGTLHRIDPAIVKRDFAAAGFVLDAESDVLRNPADDLSKGVFDPAVRGKTDRFMLRFRRP